MATQRDFRIDWDNEFIVGTIYDVAQPKGTAIIQHGLSGYKEQDYIQTMVQCCVDAGWRTIIFDCRHSYGASSGDIIHATVSSYAADLARVIDDHVAADEKLILLGHSLGGGSILKYTTQHPERVFAIAPMATILSHDLYVANHMARDPDAFRAWQETGRYLKKSSTRPDRQGYVSFDLVEDLKDLKILESLDRLTMPAFFMVGADDDLTPPEQQKLLYEGWRGRKEYHVVPQCAHTFKDEKGLAILQDRLGTWLAGLDT